MLTFHIYDVFTDTPFTGNPLAIVEAADALTAAQMQTIARQFNLSETIFIQTPDDPAHTAKVRIFFPTAEIPFAGHPTIGCALHLAQGVDTTITLEEVAGLVPVTITNGTAEFTAPKLPKAQPYQPDAATLAAALGLPREALIAQSHFEGGPTFIYAELRNLDDLANAKITGPAYEDVIAQAQGTAAIYAFAKTAPDHIRARMFDPAAGIPEDPATGSATAILAGHLAATGAIVPNGTNSFQMEQGVEMGRPSKLRLTIDSQNGAPTAIRVAGQAVPVAQGQTKIPT